ncbi:MAG: exo-alpha-sialidase [Lachnospiraceae bacterium]|nr:exo-alpha-sialidase [Lachnospiraceae bacterium]
MLITDKEALNQFYSDYRVWQGIPAIERTADGRLFCTFYSGRATETYGNYCVVLQSDDDGHTWTEPICAAYDGEMNRCFDPQLWIDPLGRLWFTWCRGNALDLYGAICDHPDADRLVWSEEFFIGTGVMACKPVVLSTGEWLFPLALWDLWAFSVNLPPYSPLYINSYLKNSYKYSGANVYRSTDNGKTITPFGSCQHIHSRSFDEHMIYEKNNGVLVMLTRTTYGISRSFSYDRGANWTIAENSGIPGPSSRFHVRRLKSGRLLLINHDNFTGRNNLTAFLSEDEGATWPYKLLLDSRGNVSYPDMTEGDDGYLYIIYDHERGAYQSSLEEAQKCAREILVSKINETDILKGALQSPAGYVKQIASKLGEYKGTCNYYSKFCKINPEEFIDTVMSYENVDDILETIFVHYPVNCQNMHCTDAEKMDEIIGKIKACRCRSEIKPLLTTLITLLNNVQKSAVKTREEPLVNHMIEYLQANINEEIDINELARNLNVSVYYLCHLFKKKTGLSLYEYRNACRFAEAKRLLADTDLKISEICSKCGFSDSSYFARKFRESENISPTEYRNLHRSI